MDLRKLEILFIFLILFSVSVLGVTSMNFLTRGQGDIRYCLKNQDCEFWELTVYNLSVIGDIFNVTMTVVNWNVTGSFNVGGNLEAKNVTADNFFGNCIGNVSGENISDTYVPYGTEGIKGAIRNVNLGYNLTAIDVIASSVLTSLIKDNAGTVHLFQYDPFQEHITVGKDFVSLTAEETITGEQLTSTDDITADDDITAGDEFFASSGSSSDPAYSFTSCPTTGVSCNPSGAENYYIITDGALRVDIDSICADFNVPIKVDHIQEDTVGHNIVLDNNLNISGYVLADKVGIGIVPVQELHVIGDSNITGTGYFGGNVGVGDSPSSGTIRFLIATSGLPMSQRRYTNTATQGSGMTIVRARGTVASPAGVQEGDHLGAINWQGYNSDGANFDTSAIISAFIDGEPSTGSDSSDMPSRLEFKTSRNGQSVGALAMTIDSNQTVKVKLITTFGGGFGNTGATIYDNGNASFDGVVISDNVFIPQYIFSHTNATIPVLQGVGTLGNWTNITFSQEDSDVKYGISHIYNDETNHTFMIMDDGVYEINYDFDVEDTSVGASDIDIAGRVILDDGTEVLGSVFETDITKQGAEVELTHDFLVECLAGDILVFQFIASDDDVHISTHGAYGEHPESATIVINKIANLP